MKLLLKSFSQDVDFSNPENTANFLVFVDEETGQTLRLPVPRETILELVRLSQGENAEEPKAPEPPAYPEGATQFGAEEAEDEDLDDGPESEEAIGSL